MGEGSEKQKVHGTITRDRRRAPAAAGVLPPPKPGLSLPPALPFSPSRAQWIDNGYVLFLRPLHLFHCQPVIRLTNKVNGETKKPYLIDIVRTMYIEC